MANKQKQNYSLGYNTRDQVKALAGSAKGRNTAGINNDGMMLECQLTHCFTVMLNSIFN